MHSKNQKDSQPTFLGEFVEVQQQIQLWSPKATERWPTPKALAFELSADVSQSERSAERRFLPERRSTLTLRAGLRTFQNAPVEAI
jgi:hypothetical protein